MERVFPSVPIVVSKGDEFEAPAGLTARGLTIVTKEDKKKEIKEDSKPSASSDITVGDE
jgi:hypothetical protein